MKFFIKINQLVLSQTNLDIKDAAILDYLIGFCSTTDRKVKQLEMTDDGLNYKYTWINFKYLIEQMPLLGIKNKSAISRRIKKIEKCGFIKTFLTPNKDIYITLLPKIKELEFFNKDEAVALKQQGCCSKATGVLPYSNSTINILDNNISYNNKLLYGDSFEKESPKDNLSLKEEKEKRDPRIKEVFSFFQRAVEEIEGYSPAINFAKDGAVVKKGLKVIDKNDVKWQELILSYIYSKEAEKLGISLSIIFSAGIINKFLANKLYVEEIYREKLKKGRLKK